MNSILRRGNKSVASKYKMLSPYEIFKRKSNLSKTPKIINIPDQDFARLLSK